LLVLAALASGVAGAQGAPPKVPGTCARTVTGGRQVVCTVTWDPRRVSTTLLVRVSRHGRTYAQRRLTTAGPRGRIRLRSLRQVRAGRYTLSLTVVDRAGRRVTQRRSITL
jgi:hypothetical protein